MTVSSSPKRRLNSHKILSSHTKEDLYLSDEEEEDTGSVNYMLNIFSHIFSVLFSAVLRILLMPKLLALKAFFHKRPSPEEVLKMGKPRRDEQIPHEYSQVNDAVANEIRLQLLSGRQLGLHVVAYREGKLVVDVHGGVRRSAITGKWVPLEKDALFMSFSVCKGVSATALMTAVDRGHLSYDQSVSSIWPEFGCHGKDTMSVECAVSHRDGVRRLLPMQSVVPALMRSSSNSSNSSQSHQHLWERGIKWVESYKPDWQPGTRAMYNPVTWSWIIGGIMERATGKSIHETVQTDIASVLGEEKNMYLGLLPEEYLSRVALREPTLNYASGKKISFLDKIFAVIEASILCVVGNSKWWSQVCLPSSNGFFTARSIGKMYGALANQGTLHEGDTTRTLVSPQIIDSLIETISDNEKHLPHPASAQLFDARMSRGYGPWKFPSHQGENAHRCFGHSGLGGCVGFADPDEKIAICVMKTGYEPHFVVGAEGSPDAAKLCRIIRDSLRNVKA